MSIFMLCLLANLVAIASSVCGLVVAVTLIQRKKAKELKNALENYQETL